MAYIGNTAASRFVSNRAASVYSGDGSTVAFTLEQVVTQDEDVLVSVDGVVQEPSVGYAVSSGTTLTFSAAPSSNSGNNIFVYYLASQAGTIGHPSTQALSATIGTFSSNATVAGTIAVAGASTLTGATALGNTGSTIKSEGGAVTTNIAQGLAKAWGQWNASQALQGSFNCASITDTATGRATFAITSDMANDDYSIATAGSNGSASATIYSSDPNTLAAATFIVNIFAASNGAAFQLADRSINLVVVHGDLA